MTTTVLDQEVKSAESKTATTARETEHPGAVAKRFGVNLRQTDVERLYDIARAHDITPTEVFRRAIATEYKLLKIVDEGGQILAKRSDDVMLELDLQY